jgi:RimJ/RimL family protein N-acetyltransferase
MMLAVAARLRGDVGRCRARAREGVGLPVPAAEVLASDRLRLTPLRVDDATEMLPVLAEPLLYRFTGGSAPSLEELERCYILQCTDSPEPGVAWRNWIVRLSEDGQAVGFVQATVTDEVAALAWVVGLRWQRQGIATEATTAVCRWLATVGIERLEAHIHPEHRASARIAQAVGLSPTGEVDADGEEIWAGTP